MPLRTRASVRIQLSELSVDFKAHRLMHHEYRRGGDCQGRLRLTPRRTGVRGTGGNHATGSGAPGGSFGARTISHQGLEKIPGGGRKVVRDFRLARLTAK